MWSVANGRINKCDLLFYPQNMRYVQRGDISAAKQGDLKTNRIQAEYSTSYRPVLETWEHCQTMHTVIRRYSLVGAALQQRFGIRQRYRIICHLFFPHRFTVWHLNKVKNHNIRFQKIFLLLTVTLNKSPCPCH